MHRNLTSAKKLLSWLKEFKYPCFTGGWKEWQVNPEMATFKWNQHYFDARFWERSLGHTVSVIKNIIYPRVYSNRHHFISHFSSSFTALILKRRWRFFLPWRKFCPKWKVIKERCFAFRSTDVAAQVSFPYWEKDWPFDLRSHKMKLNSINLPKFTIRYVKELLGLNQHHKSHEH